MSDGLQTLLEALYRLGNEDIYTDSWEYRGRRQAMGALLGLVGRHLKGERITAESERRGRYCKTRRKKLNSRRGGKDGK